MFDWYDNHLRRQRVQSLLTVSPTINYCKLEVEYGSLAKFLVFVGVVVGQCIYKEILFKGMGEFFFWAAIFATVLSVFNKCYWYTVGFNNRKKLYSATSYRRYGLLPRFYYHTCRWIGAIGIGVFIWLVFNYVSGLPFGDLFVNKSFNMRLFKNGHFEYMIPALMIALGMEYLFVYFKYFMIKDLPFYVPGVPRSHHVKTGPIVEEPTVPEPIVSEVKSGIQKNTYYPITKSKPKVYAPKPEVVEPKPFEKAKPIILPDIYNQDKKAKTQQNKDDLKFSRTPRRKKD